MNQRVSKRSIGVARDPMGLKPTLNECLDTFLAHADTLVDGVLEGLAKAASAPVGMSGRLSDTDAGISTVDQLLSYRSVIRVVFSESLHKGMFHGPGMDQADRAPVKFEELRFFEEAQLDESIEMARIVEEIERAASEVLPATHALMSSLLGWVSVQPRINPVRPEVFARALADAFTDHVRDPSVRERIYTIAAGYLGMGLARLYKQNIDWLRSMGIEPAGIHFGDATPVRGTAFAQAPAAESSIAKTLLTLDRLRKLLMGQVELESPQLASLLAASGGRDFLHTIPASMVALQDMKQVEALVARLADKAKEGKTPAEQARQKSLAVELRLGKQLGRHLGNEVIRLMVENLTQDDRLLAPVRELLQQIEPQLTKLGNADQRFFSDKSHPARRLVERIVQRSLGFAETSEPGFIDFFKSVKLVINSLAQPSDGVVQAFTDACELLETTWAQHDAAQQRRQEEAARRLLHAEQRNLLAQRIAADLEQRVMGKAVPDNVMGFLCGPWAQTLAERQLTGAGASPAFESLADDLIWSVQKRLARRNPTKLVQMIPTMLRTLREGLRCIDYPELATHAFFEQLISLHEASLEGLNRKSHDPVEALAATEAAEASDASDAVIDDATDPVDPFWVGATEGSTVGFLDAAQADSGQTEAAPGLSPSGFGGAQGESSPPVASRELAVGDWVELQIQGAWTRVSLKWTSPYRNLFMFVGTNGLAHSMTRRTLEKLRGNGMIRVVAQGDIVEQALDGVVQTAMRNSLKNQEQHERADPEQ